MSAPKNQYIYQIRLNRPALLIEGPTNEEARVLQDHVSYLEKLAEESVVLLAGRTQNNDLHDYGIVILCARSEAEARDIMNNDPAVKHKVMQADFNTYKIAVLADSIVQQNESLI